MTAILSLGRQTWLFGLALGMAAALAPAFALATADAVPKQFPIRDFFKESEMAYFRISDDGKTLGFMQPTAVDGNPRRLNVFVQPLEGSKLIGEARRLTAETARDIFTYYWKGNDTILFVKDFGGDGNTHVVAVDVASGKVTDLTPGDQVRAGIQDDLPDDPRHILVRHNRRNAEVFDVYRIHLETGKETLIATNPGDIVRWQTDHAGRLRMAVRNAGLQTIMVYRKDETSEFEPIITTDYKTAVTPMFFSADNSQFYALSNRGRDKQALVLIDPEKPADEKVVYVHPEVDLDSAAWSRARKKLTHVDYVTAKAARKYFDARTEALFKQLEKKLPGMEISLQANNKAETKFIVASANDRTPGSRYLFDAKADTITKLADINPDIPESAMAPVQPIQYQSRDGLTINGYLTLPIDREDKNLACIVNPHGGPWTRDVWGYNPEIQFLANRGYCILQINFRGSTGYGREFWEASFGQWGLKMQDDITDGVNWLIKQGIADPKRVGIYGLSYGGYATLAGVVYTPDLYAAAVDYVGVSNLLTHMATLPPYFKPLMPQFHEMIGHPEKDRARMQATSPALHADKIKTPLFIAQGANDPSVKRAESDQMVEALKKRGVDVQYMVKDNEGHGFNNEENRFEFYEAMERFFDKHLNAGSRE